MSNKKKVLYLTENDNWVTYEVAKEISENLDAIDMRIHTATKLISSTPIIHYGSMNVLLGDFLIPFRKNRVVATVFHIVDSDKRKEKLKHMDKYVDKWHTSCSITKSKMIKLGIPEEKIEIIPIPTDGEVFFPVHETEKNNNRINLGITDKNTIVVGYFQKDGNGWDEGLEPKLIKGPDIFCDVIEELSKEYSIHVILSGPARGYVKKRLEKAGVPYTHYMYDDARKVAELYHLIDIYMVTSREEGGPRAVLEAMNSGIPIISTRVGQAQDLIKCNQNGVLVDVGDRVGIEKAFRTIVEDEDFRKHIVEEGSKTAKIYSLESIAQQYKEKLYKEL